MRTLARFLKQQLRGPFRHHDYQLFELVVPRARCRPETAMPAGHGSRDLRRHALALTRIEFDETIGCLLLAINDRQLAGFFNKLGAQARGPDHFDVRPERAQPPT